MEMDQALVASRAVSLSLQGQHASSPQAPSHVRAGVIEECQGGKIRFMALVLVGLWQQVHPELMAQIVDIQVALDCRAVALVAVRVHVRKGITQARPEVESVEKVVRHR
jgi:hypothetical protein